MSGWNDLRYLNANEKVRIKPTDDGRRFLRQYYRNLQVGLVRDGSVSPVRAEQIAEEQVPKPDVGGWIELQLHEVMAIFGPAMGHAYGDSLFDMNIQVDASSLKVRPTPAGEVGRLLLFQKHDGLLMGAELRCPNQGCKCPRSKTWERLTKISYRCVDCCFEVTLGDHEHQLVLE